MSATMTDCLLLGFYDLEFLRQVELVRAMGPDSGAFRDLSLAYLEQEGRPYRAMDALNLFRPRTEAQPDRIWHNADFLWPTILYLGSYLNRRGFGFDYVNLPHLEWERLRDRLEQGGLRTVAITTTLYVSPQPILDLISFIRDHGGGLKIVVGGPYIANQARMLPQPELAKLLKYLGADFYVIEQEGELTLSRLLGALKHRGSLATVPNLAYREDQEIRFTEAEKESNPLDEEPVDYSLFPAHEIGEFLSLRTAKSCPFACSFCGFPQRAGKYRYLGLDPVEAELDRIREIGTVTTLTFLDDTFNVPKKRFHEILRLMARKGYGFRWNSFYRCDHGDEETIGLMRDAGCEGVFLGVESGSDAMLGRMNKSARRADYLAAIPQLRQAGISTHANFIVGFPGETLATVEESLSLIEEARPDFFRAQLWYADPVTPIWERRHEYGVQGSAFNWSHDTMDYRTACDLVDWLFLSVERSHWLPQHSFEQWSTFYLQRKGLPLGDVKRFVGAFNRAVRQKLLLPGRRGLVPEVLAELERSARAGAAGVEDPSPLGPFSAAAALRARQHLEDVVAPTSPWLAADLLAGGRHAAREVASVEAGDLARPMAELASLLGVVVPAVYAGLWAACLARLSGCDELSFRLRMEGPTEPLCLPLALQLGSETTLEQVVREADRQIELAAPHAVFSRWLLDALPRISAAGAKAAQVDTAVLLLGDAEQEEGLDAGLSLWLEVPVEEGHGGARLCFDRGVFDPETASAIAAQLRELAAAAVSGSGFLLSAPAEETAEGAALAPGDDGSEMFRF